MKFLIAGFGSIGRRHFHNLLALGEGDFVFYRTMRSTLPNDELKDHVVEYSLEAALAQQPDAVIIANPTALHLDVAIPAAEAGCHIFIEKPISHSMQNLKKLQDAVAENGVQVFVGYQFRFHPGLQKVKNLLTEGALGKPLSVRAHWGEYLPGWHPWEDYRQGYSARQDLGGGVILTLCHPIDYLRWLLGEIAQVWAFTASQSELGIPVEDTAEIGLRFTNGAIGSVHLNYTQRPPVHHLEIICERGTIRWDNADGNAQIFKAEGKDVQEWQTISIPKKFTRNDLFINMMRHFLTVVKGQSQSSCTLQDGVRALQIALAAHQSQTENCLVQF